MQIPLKQTILATFVVTALFLPVIGQAATYYVATSGSNSNPGTSTKPWKTVNYATSKMVAGDTTYVRGGTYNEGIVRFGRSGTQSAPIKLLNASGEFPVINFIDKNQQHKILIQNTAGYWKAIGWITIEGFELRNGYEGIKMNNGHNITIRRNWIHHNSSQGIIGIGTRILIDRNKITHNGPFATNPSGTFAHGMYVGGTAWTVINNLIYDNLGYGIQMNATGSYDPTRYAGPEYAASANWVVLNNTFAYSANRSGMVIWGSTCNNARIENNIFYENAVKMSSATTQGISFQSVSCKGITIRNNLSYASGSGGARFLSSGATEGTHYTQSGNIVNTLKPAFANAPATLPSSPNFALPSGSPAIDKGLVISTARIAFNGTTRPKGSSYDVGAYEYSGSTSQLVLAAPTSAQAQ